MQINTQMRKSSSRAMKLEDLQKDLLHFQEKALELGASSAAVIPASYVVVEERVWMKCLVPRCPGAGRTPYCPPNNPQPDFVRRVVAQYQWAVLLKRDVGPVEDYTSISQEAREELWKQRKGYKGGPFHDKTWEIVGRLESYAQTKGYDLAMGLSGGSCNSSMCRGAPCAVLQNEACRHPLHARPSMEAFGIDVFGLVAKVGWDAYLIRSIEPNPSEIPCGLSVGIVFVY